MLFGTPDQVSEEIRSRIAATGIRYNIVAPMTPDSFELFTKDVLPNFN